MSLLLLANLIKITSNGVLQERYQNAKNTGVIRLNNQNYSFLSFIYQGATRNRTGDNLESTLVLANNPLALNLGLDAVQNRWSVRVDTCSLNTSNFNVTKTLSTEFWIAASVAYDPLTVEITLSSSIDAVGANSPNRVLTQKQVGALPTTSQIQNR